MPVGTYSARVTLYERYVADDIDYPIRYEENHTSNVSPTPLVFGQIMPL